MAKTLHSLDILNSESFTLISNLQLSNNHLAAIVLVEELTQDMVNNNKYKAFLKYLKTESSLVYTYYSLMRQSKLMY